MKTPNKNNVFTNVFLLAVGLASVGFFLNCLFLAIENKFSIADDFNVVLEAAKALLANKVEPYKYDGGTNYHPYLYAPFFLFLLYPLNLLDYNSAYIFWFAWQFFWFVAGAKAYLKTFKISGRTSSRLLLLTLPFVVYNLLIGQMGLFVGGTLLFGFALLDKKPAIAASILALLTFKPQLAILIPFALIAKRSWCALAAFVIIVLGLSITPALIYGESIWGDYFNLLIIHANEVKNLPEQWLIQMVSPYIGFRIVGANDFVAAVLHSLLAISVTAYIYKIFRANKPGAPLMLFILMFLVSPYAFLYDLPIVSMVLIMVLLAKADNVYGRIFIIIGSFMPFIGMFIQSERIPFFFVCLVLMCLIAVRLKFDELPKEQDTKKCD